VVHAVSPADFFGDGHGGEVERSCYGCFIFELGPSRAVVPRCGTCGCVGEDVSDKGVPSSNTGSPWPSGLYSGLVLFSLEESPSSSRSRTAKLCISFVGVSDLLLITGYVIRCG